MVYLTFSQDTRASQSEPFNSICLFLLFGIMAENQSISRTQWSSRQTTRLKWTTQMNRGLLECKVKAKEIVASQNPPRHEMGGRKVIWL